MQVSIADQATFGTLKGLTSTQLVVDYTTTATGLRGVGLIDQHHLTPWILPHLGEKTLAETIVGPGEHGTGCLGLDPASTSTNHVANSKIRQEHHSISLTEPLDQLAMEIIDKMADLLSQPGCCPSSVPPAPMAFCVDSGLQLVKYIAEAANALDIMISPHCSISIWTVERPKDSHSCNTTMRREWW